MKLICVLALSFNWAMAATPKEVCTSLAKAAGEDNFKAFADLTMSEGKKAAGKEKNFHSMHKDKLTQLKELVCGTEMIAGTRAIVETTGPKEKRLIPFVEIDGNWKFDAGTYRSFYKPAKK